MNALGLTPLQTKHGVLTALRLEPKSQQTDNIGVHATLIVTARAIKGFYINDR